MSFDPFKQKVKPVSEAFESWKELFVKPYDKDHVDPYTRLRIILMNGTEFATAKETLRFEARERKHTRDNHRLRAACGGADGESRPPREGPVCQGGAEFCVARRLRSPLQVLQPADARYVYRRRGSHRAAHGDNARAPHHRRAPLSRGRCQAADRQFDGSSADPPLRVRDNRRRAADYELLHECRQHLSDRRRQAALPRDRHDRGATCHAIRLSDGHLVQLARGTARARVHRVLSLLQLRRGRKGSSHRKDLGSHARTGTFASS